MKEKLKIEDLIPDGLHCHGPDWKNDRCPFWRRLPNRRPQENGYCLMMHKGDFTGNWQGFGLLWDQCKECGIKMDYDKDELEVFAVLPADIITK